MAIRKKEAMFRSRLFKAFIMVGIVPMIILVSLYYYNISKFTNSRVDKSVKENLEITSRLIDSTMYTFKSMTNYISYNEEIQNILKIKDYNNYENKFNEVQKVYKVFNSILATQSLDVPIHIIDTKKKSRYSTTDYFAPIYEGSRGDFFHIMDRNENKATSYIHRRVDGENSRDIVMAIGRPIKDDKDSSVLGYVVSDVYDDYFNTIFNNTNAYEGNNVYILDGDGYIITDKKYKNRTGFKFYEEYLEHILNKDNGSFNCNINGVEYRAYFSTTEHSSLKVVQLIPIKILYSETKITFITFLFLTFIVAVVSIIAAYLLSNRISKPINKLSNLMKKVEEGDRDVNFDLNCDDEIGRLGMSFNDMVKEINRLIEEVYVKQYLLQEAEFKALKAQVNPHFLYNTLQSVNWMAKLKDCEGVSTMVTALGKFLRYSISKQGDLVTVSQEIEQVENYLTIQKIRYGDKITSEIHIGDEIKKCSILRFLLQPIVENSIVHGLEPKLSKGHLIINGYLDGEIINFDIMDNGVGFGNSEVKGEGIGMDNVNERIKIHYGEVYGVFVERVDEFTCIKIKIPMEVMK